MTGTVNSFWDLKSLGIADAEKRNAEPVIRSLKEKMALKEERNEVALPWKSADRINGTAATY